MMILKGDYGKSRIIGYILSGTDPTETTCFVYNDYPIHTFEDTIYIDSTKYSLDDLKECIKEDFMNSPNKLVNYLIVYTNKKEEELETLIKWLDNLEWTNYCVDMLLTCK